MHRAAMEDVDVEPVHKKQKIDVELLDVDATQQQVKTIEEYFTKHFPEQIPTLQTLNASSNYITKFSLLSSSQSKLFDGTYLTRLLVNANNLAEMPPVSAFPNCIELCLNNNKIPELTSELRALTKLERLDLRFNRIEVLQHIDHLTNLKHLTLSSNRLTSLQGLPPQMPHLQFLGLFSNQLANFEETLSILSRYPSITDLYIAGNPLFPVEVLQESSQNRERAIQIINVLPNLVWLNGKLASSWKQ